MLVYCHLTSLKPFFLRSAQSNTLQEGRSPLQMERHKRPWNTPITNELLYKGLTAACPPPTRLTAMATRIIDYRSVMTSPRQTEHMIRLAEVEEM